MKSEGKEKKGVRKREEEEREERMNTLRISFVTKGSKSPIHIVA